MASKKLKPENRGVKTGLNDKQRHFVHLYLTTNGNAAEAARLAGYSAPNAGSKLMANRLIARAIGNEMRIREERTKVKADRVLMEWASIGLVSIQDTLDSEGNFIPPHKLPRHVAAAIYSIEWRVIRDPFTRKVIDREVANYVFWDKLNALGMMAKHLGMLDGRFKDEENVNVETLLSRVLNKMQSNSPVVDENAIEVEMAKLPDHSSGNLSNGPAVV